MKIEYPGLICPTSYKYILVTIPINVGHSQGGSFLGQHFRDQPFVIKVVVIILFVHQQLGIAQFFKQWVDHVFVIGNKYFQCLGIFKGQELIGFNTVEFLGTVIRPNYP